MRTALHPFGVRVRTTELSQLCRLHTYRELLFTLRVKGTIRGTADELSQALLDGGLVTLLEHTHTEDAPFYFRIEVRGVEDTVQKTALAKEMAQALEQGSGGKLLNSTTDYEVEVRLTRTKDGSFYPCLKLYTIGDDRFAWRKQTISASMHPSLAAALIELSRPYLSEQAVVLDALCGVGTFVIEGTFDRPFIVTNCDILIDADYEDLYRYHVQSGNELTIVTALKNIVVPYGVIHSSENGAVMSMEEKPRLSYFVNTGMYILNPKLLEEIPEGTFFHMTDLSDALLKQGRKVGMYPISEDSFLDMGEFEEMHRMEAKLNQKAE